MIDFRYHLVSLVSVFLALAIGVVLGAGPLRDTIGATLEDQVQALRQDKVNLQEAVTSRDALLERRESFVEAVAPELLRGRLAGAQVAVGGLPGGDLGVGSRTDALQTVTTHPQTGYERCSSHASAASRPSPVPAPRRAGAAAEAASIPDKNRKSPQG